MFSSPERANENLGVCHGKWGEVVAVDYLRRHGFEIIERNARPVAKDRRLEIDIIAWERKIETLVFVEVKQHKTISPYARRLQSITKRKRENLRRACSTWRCKNKWRGALRFDVIEVYGVPEGGPPIIDHIRNVHLFGRSDRFFMWG